MFSINTQITFGIALNWINLIWILLPSKIGLFLDVEEGGAIGRSIVCQFELTRAPTHTVVFSLLLSALFRSLPLFIFYVQSNLSILNSLSLYSELAKWRNNTALFIITYYYREMFSLKLKIKINSNYSVFTKVNKKRMFTIERFDCWTLTLSVERYPGVPVKTQSTRA
jgi:hypothetical protein